MCLEYFLVEPSHADEAKVMSNTLVKNGKQNFVTFVDMNPLKKKVANFTDLSVFISNLSLDEEGGMVLSTQTTMSVNGIGEINQYNNH